MPVLSKDAGIQGVPSGRKEQGGSRIDFRVLEFDLAIETKGARVAWSRAAQCPCQSVNDQTDQSDPLCDVCKGTGWILFRPEGGTTEELLVGGLDAIQRRILTDSHATVIRALMTAFTPGYAPHDKATPREHGTVNVTTRAPNKLGYYDRLTNLDTVIVYSQILDVAGDRLPTKYVARDVNLLRSRDVVFARDVDYRVVDGVVEWIDGMAPEDGTRVVCHYYTHPTWRVMEHPHAIRYTLQKAKIRKPATPRGNEVEMPVQAVARLEFLL